MNNRDLMMGAVLFGSGEGGSYNDLTNKPQINSVTLSGNKSLSDLGIQGTLTAGDNITISNGEISATDTTYEAGDNITITDGVIAATDTTYTAGTNITIADEVISFNGTIPTKTSDLTNDSGFLTQHQSLSAYRTSADQDVIDAGKQATLTAGSNITINNNTISATDTTYTAGSNVTITDGVIAATDTTYTAGSNVSIVDGVISATDTTYTAGSNVTITDGVIAATDTTYSDATTSASGLMSAADKTKLNGVSTGANAVSVSSTGTATDEISYITIDGTEKKIAGGGGGGGSYTFTNGLTESSGTVSWDLNDRIHAGTSSAAEYGLILGKLHTTEYDGGNTNYKKSSFIIGSRNNNGTDSYSGCYSSFIIGQNNNIADRSAMDNNGSHCYIIGTDNQIKNYKSQQGPITITGYNHKIEDYNSTSYGNTFEGAMGASVYNCTYNLSSSTICVHKEGYDSGPRNGYINYDGQGMHIEGHHDYSTYPTGFSYTVKGVGSHSEGSAIAQSDYQHAEGKHNILDDQNTYAHICGNGVYGYIEGETVYRGSNAYTLDWQGNAVFAGTVSSVGSDYAEYFEWLDGNPLDEDRIGYIVALNGEKIDYANDQDDVLGIVSGTATVLGDQAEWYWHKRYLQDEYGRFIYEDYDIVHEEGTEHEWVEHVHTRKQNPDWDPEEPYTKRSDRPEWSEIGMMGKLYVRDDGTCAVNGYVKPVNGIGTASAEPTRMRVMARVNDHVVKVLLK